MVTVVTVMAVMAVGTVVTAAMMTAAVAATVAATVTAGFSPRGERRQADNNRCGEGEERSALQHFRGSLI
ncbi:MAG: hypothetical protein K2Y71_15550 [Xanthobacteraceae bacterium]|nr:hypothetical protein [Xanthobacteraceae bacterium]